jgi:hypothetical protein
MNSVEKHALRLIGEDVSSPDVFTDDDTGLAPIRDSINDAIQEINMVTGAYHATYLLPLYTDRIFYRLGFERDHFGWVYEAWDRSRQFRLQQVDLIWLTRYDPFWMQTNGYPEKYVHLSDDLLAIYNKPSSNGIVLELDCVCIPKPYTTDTDPVKLREHYQRAAAYLATSEYWASRGNAKRAAEHFGNYIQTASLMNLTPEYQEKIHQQQTEKGYGEFQQ